MPDNDISSIGSCPKCGSEVKDTDKSYKCQCGFAIWKQISGRNISSELASELLTTGKSKTMTFISPKNHKSFKANLILRCGKVEMEYTENKPGEEPKDKKNEVVMRVESEMSGKSFFDISGSVFREINFGIIPSRLAECYACIAAVKYLIYKREPTEINLNISINGIDFAKCLLKESKPRDKEMLVAIIGLWELLANFKSWKAMYFDKENRPRSEVPGKMVVFDNRLQNNNLPGHSFYSGYCLQEFDKKAVEKKCRASGTG